MATAETVHLGEPHDPKNESISVFEQIEHDLKKALVHLRHQLNKHEPRYFAAAEHLSDAKLAGFSSKDLCQVRVAHSAYGLHLFGKVRIPSLPEDGPAYIHFRAFKGGPEGKCSLHSIHIEEKPLNDRTHSFRAIFSRDDLLEWFDT